MADTPTSAARPMLPEYEDIAEVVTRLEGDAALLRGEYDELERAENMDKAAGLLRALLDANYAVAKLLLEQDRDGAQKWARGLYISMDTQGGLTVSATPAASEVEAVQAQPASAPMGGPSIYDALPPSAMDWLTSSDPHLAATQEWQDGWDACRNRVHMRVDAAIKRAHGISGESSGAARKVEHVCGRQGYTEMLDPPCPACEANRLRNAGVADAAKTGDGTRNNTENDA